MATRARRQGTARKEEQTNTNKTNNHNKTNIPEGSIRPQSKAGLPSRATARAARRAVRETGAPGSPNRTARGDTRRNRSLLRAAGRAAPRWSSAPHRADNSTRCRPSRSDDRAPTRSPRRRGPPTATVPSASAPASRPTRHPIDQQVDRQPREPDEAPVKRVLAYVHEPPADDAVLGVHQCGKHERVTPIRQDMGRVQHQQRPHDRAVSIIVPLPVQAAELDDAD